MGGRRPTRRLRRPGIAVTDPVPALPFDPIAAARANWVTQSWALPDVMAAVTSIVRVHQVLTRRCDEALAPHDLTFARYEVLALLTFSRTGALPMGKVGERLQVSPASVTNAVDRLEASGYVRRRPHPTDGRTTLAQLTPAGRDVVERATPGLTDVRFGVDGLDDAAAVHVVELLRPVRAAAGDFPADARLPASTSGGPASPPGDSTGPGLTRPEPT